MSQHSTRALFHLVHTYEMLSLLSEGKLQHFYVNSNLEELLSSNMAEVKFETLVEIHDRLKRLELVS